jgi:hypothetical protein
MAVNATNPSVIFAENSQFHGELKFIGLKPLYHWHLPSSKGSGLFFVFLVISLD